MTNSAKPNAGARLAELIHKKPAPWRAQMGRSGTRGTHELELEELLVLAGLDWLRGAARDRVLAGMTLMCLMRRGEPRNESTLSLGTALGRRDQRAGTAAGRKTLELLGRADALSINRALFRAAQQVRAPGDGAQAAWPFNWGGTLQLLIDWNDPRRRAEGLRRIQLDYLYVNHKHTDSGEGAEHDVDDRAEGPGSSDLEGDMT